MTTTALAPLSRDADFRRFFAANAVSKLGTQISYLAIPLVAIHALGADIGQVGVLGVLGSVAFLVIGLPAGAWVERTRKRWVMVVADLARAGLLASVPVGWALGVLTMAQLYLVTLLVGVATVFFDVASGAYVPHLVGRDRLVAANSMLGSVHAGADVAGPGVGGFLVQLVGAPLAVVVDAASYLWSALFLRSVRKSEPAPETVAQRHLGREVREGLRFVFSGAILRVLAIESAWTNLCLRVIITVVPVLFVVELDLPDAWIGGFLGVGGVGVFIGSLLARRVADRLGHGRALWIIGATCGPFALLIPLAEPGALLWIALGGWLVTTIKVGVDSVLKSSLRQRISPDRMLSRIGATYRFMITGALAIGSGLAGVLGEATTLRVTMWLAAAGLALGWVLLLLSPLRSLRVMPDHDPAI